METRSAALEADALPLGQLDGAEAEMSQSVGMAGCGTLAHKFNPIAVIFLATKRQRGGETETERERRGFKERERERERGGGGRDLDLIVVNGCLLCQLFSPQSVISLPAICLSVCICLSVSLCVSVSVSSSLSLSV